MLPIFFIAIVGVLQFGRAITYWLDLNDSAHVGVRYAVTNRFPGCFKAGDPACGNVGFETFVKSNLNSAGLKANTTMIVCYKDVDGNNVPNRGDSVTVKLRSPFNIVGFLKIDMMLQGKGTMRFEQASPALIGIAPADKCVP